MCCKKIVFQIISKYLLQFQMSAIPCYVEYKMQIIYLELGSETLFNLRLVLFPSFPLRYKKSLQLSLFFFFLILLLGVSEIDCQKFFCEYPTICYPGSLWPRSDLFPKTHREIVLWESVYCYSRRVWPMTSDVLSRKFSKGGIKWACESMFVMMQIQPYTW